MSESPWLPLPKQPRFVQLADVSPADLRAELADGLAAEAASIAPKYFYDALGSRLFDAITDLPEYYPTRTEAGILAARRWDIAEAVGRARTLIDLGAGNCEKASRLFSTLAPARYVAVDISVEFLRRALAALQREHPELDLVGLGQDFSRALRLPAEVGDGPRTFFYPGSSIGNFTPEDACAFLCRVRAGSPGCNLVIGVDLVKDQAVLEAAYDDPLGVTAAFNRNVLLHVNRLLGSDFALADWRHVALFNAAESRIEMHLEARRAVDVRWPGGGRRFAAGERIHSENSYKYGVETFGRLLRQAGYAQTHCWTDERGWFAVFCAS
ncbi:MAG TPA: L-histidine N(alpha)-methyltransferase [Burkholderiaceae bacterium]|nr:L-histidine N(alpha)-methyltransferase [Burkholderiaceae bacterium]